MRNKTKNIKKCVNQMCQGKPKMFHYGIKDKYIKSRGRKIDKKKK